MKIGNRNISRHSRPYIIAEIGVNHDGCLKRAEDLLRQTAAVGADAVKFQIFDAGMLLSSHASLTQGQRDGGEQSALDMLQRLALSFAELRHLIEIAHGLNLHAVASVFSEQLVKQASEQPWDAFKVASPDIVNEPLLEALMRTGRPLFLSTGAATMQEVNAARQQLGCYPFALMHCVSAYPTPDEHANLGGISFLSTGNDQAVGYSDHTTSVDTGAMAVIAGASVLEKHVTFNRKANGPDHAMSLEPANLANYVSLAHRAYEMIGERVKEPQPVEREVRTLTRQSLTSTRFLSQGTVIEAGDLTLKRPGHGLPPSALKQTIGRQLAVDLEADVPIQLSDLI